MTTKPERSVRFFVVRAALTVLTAAALACELPTRALNNDHTAVVVLAPHSLSLLPNQSTTLIAIALTSTGDTAPAAVTWSVTGGAMLDTSSTGGLHYGHYQASAT